MKKYILDMDKYTDKARAAAAEGQVIIRNVKNTLPFAKGTEVAVFGRIQNHYYKSGTGSGGMVNVSKVIGITEALEESEFVTVNRRLQEEYARWEESNPYDEGNGWGGEPWSQKEMEISDELASEIAKETQTALVIIGRTAGEDRDNKNAPGSYLLSEGEEMLLRTVRRHFEKLTVVLNVGNIIDMSFVDKFSPDAVLYAWQGGMIGGLGTADVLTGKVSPSGKLTDTIAYDITDYPSDCCFGDPIRNFYEEDIYVGYRYFETFAKDKVRYPFGFGLSYTDFDIKTPDFHVTDSSIEMTVNVKNIGNTSGKEVVQIYVEAPMGKLGKPSKVLAAFKKTDTLEAAEEQNIRFSIPIRSLCSYDETGVTGYASAYVLEAGKYTVYAGNSVRDVKVSGSFDVNETKCPEQLQQAMAPFSPFERIKPVVENGKLIIGREPVPQRTEAAKKRPAEKPEETSYTGDRGYKLSDVKKGTVSLQQFIAQFSDEDLACIVRGEGMGSPKATAGTASAFGGVNNNLKNAGVPCACCDDGPSGMRLDSGAKAFSLPNGTLLACTFNCNLVEELYAFTGVEMIKNKVDCLLGPGMNIHRHPLNGRNFEYFSEDPYVTGQIAASIFKGLQSAGVTGVAKHFCANNQETRRHHMENVVSERALREIYLKGFEIAIKEGNADAIMTTYGCVNGLWTAGNYDLNTTILRKEWGFTGIVMSDWWAQINEEGQKPDKTNFAAMVRAQNDMYMVCADSSVNGTGDNTLAALEAGKLTRGELQRSAANIIRFLLHTHAYSRMEEEEIVEVSGSMNEEFVQTEDGEYYKLDGTLVVSLDGVDTKKGSSFTFGLECDVPGEYEIEVVAKSEINNELAQLPIALFNGGIPTTTFNYNGACSEWTGEKRMTFLLSKYTILRFDFVQNGLSVKDITIRLNRHAKDVPEMAWFFNAEER